LLAVATGFVCWSTYRTWNDDPWILPAPAKAVSLPISDKPASTTAKPTVNTDVIVSKNLFDPERGAGATREAEENSRSSQRVRNLILLGTVIIGNDRTAVVQDSAPAPAQGAAVQAAAPMRLKLGDDFEGYKLAEIADRRIVFTKDTGRVEVLLDYFRKVEVSTPRPVPQGQIVPPAPQAAPSPRVIPNLPRRGRVPVPGNPAPE
jgi:hypothetical protein